MSNYKKSKIFGKKEKFNLFVFLCITLFVVFILYLTSVPMKSNKSQNQFSNSELAQKNDFQQELNLEENFMDNAVQVKDDNTTTIKQKVDDKKSNNNTIASNNIDDVEKKKLSNVDSKDIAEKDIEDESTQVSTKKSITFVSPIDGSLIREYTTDTIYSKTLSTWRTREGVDFKAEIGTPVMAVLDGTVEKIDNDLTERGEYIVIKHDDGFKTIYTNLDEEVKVVNGQKVRKGEVIATVGQSSGNYSNEDYGAHLNFIMYLNNEEVNPSEYIKFK